MKKHPIRISNVIGNVASFETITYKVIDETTTSVLDLGNLDNDGEKIILVPPGVYSVELTDIGTSNCVEIREGIIVDDVCDGFNVDNINVNVPTLETYTVTFTDVAAFQMEIDGEQYESSVDGSTHFVSLELPNGSYNWQAQNIIGGFSSGTVIVADNPVTVDLANQNQ